MSPISLVLKSPWNFFSKSLTPILLVFEAGAFDIYAYVDCNKSFLTAAVSVVESHQLSDKCQFQNVKLWETVHLRTRR